jgi:hypothetical protein
LITTWHDRKIGAGTEWENEISTYLNMAQIILLLVSPSFLASEYCNGNEVKRALERHENGTARVIPIILRPLYWAGTPFSKLQALPTGAKPITKWHNVDDAFADVVQGIHKAVEELRSKNSNVHILNEVGALYEKYENVQQLLSHWTFSETRCFASAEVLKNLSLHQRNDIFAIDDGVALDQPPGFNQLDVQKVRTVCESSGIVPVELTNPSKIELLQFHFDGYNEKIDSYLLKRMKAKEQHVGIFRTKVGLTQIDYPIPRIGQPLTLHVAPLSYWTIREFNRRILGDPPDVELLALREESLGEILSAKDEVKFSCPSALYVELSIVTRDRKLVILEKNPRLSVVARRGLRWTCTIEEGLEWTRDIRDGQLDFFGTAKRGLYNELKIKQEEIASIEFCGIALEHTHLNSAILGVIVLHVSEQDLKPRIDESYDFGLRSRFISLESAFQELFVSTNENSASWHPTGRMRALFALKVCHAAVRRALPEDEFQKDE